jgi:hypothetical protein
MERQDKGSRDLESYFKAGQSTPRAVAPLKKKKNIRLEASRYLRDNKKEQLKNKFEGVETKNKIKILVTFIVTFRR